MSADNNPNSDKNSQAIPTSFLYNEIVKKIPENILDKLLKEDKKFYEYYCRALSLLYPLMIISSSNYEADYVDSLYKQRKEIDYLEDVYSNHVSRNQGILFCYPQITYFRDFYNAIDKLIKYYDLSPYYDKLYMSDDDEINGYKLYTIENGSPIMRKEEFNEFVEIWSTSKEYTFEEFYEEYDNTACSDWSKQDRYGECYGGFWKYPDGSPEKENAYDLSREDNGKGLWELPYPKRFVLKTIEMGCGNRMESVRYSNFLCEWMKRKLEQVEQVITLKRSCINAVKKYGLPTAKLPDDIKEYFDK